MEELNDDEEPQSKSSKNKKANGPDNVPGLAFKLTSKVPYKTVLKGIFMCRNFHSQEHLVSYNSNFFKFQHAMMLS